MRIYILLALSIVFTSGCIPGNITIESIPSDAEITVMNTNGEKRKIGNTPLKLATSDLFSNKESSTRITVQKTGMYRESVVIPRNFLPSDHVIQFNLSNLEKIEIEKIAGEECKDKNMNKGDYSKLAVGVANIQTLLAKREYLNAEKQLSSLIAIYPYVSVLHALLGNARFHQKDYPGAKTSYERALELDPNNVETKNILEKLTLATNQNTPSDGGN